MLVPNQFFEIKWNVKNKDWYESKGYKFTKIGDTFTVGINDLSNGTGAMVKVKCDYCGDVFEKHYYEYNNQREIVKRDCCNKKECKNKKVSDVWHEKNAISQMQKFYGRCEELNYIPVSTIDDYHGAFSKLEYICPLHGHVITTFDNFVNNRRRCIQCSWDKLSNDKRLSTQEVIDIVESKNNNKLLNPEDYVNKFTKNLQVRCGSCGEVNLRSLNSIQNSPDGACEKCGRKKTGGQNKYTPEEVKEMVESKNDNELLNPEDYAGVNVKNLKIRCGKCKNIMIRSLASMQYSLDGMCEECTNKKRGKNCRIPIEEVKQRIESVNNNVLLNPEDYTEYNRRNLKIRCGNCGEIYKTSLGAYEWDDQIRCAKCSQRISKMERRVIDFLDFYNVDYIYNCKFDDCRDIACLPFDFYLPDYNLIIETDGQHHYEPIHGDDAFIKTALHDAMKDNYCRWNNIDLLRIPYFKGNDIENIIADKLNLPFTKIEYKAHNKQTFRDHLKIKNA